MNLRLIEPLKDLFKDEVRNWIVVRIRQKIVMRHPFPGPGLAIRIVGSIDIKKVKILQEADYIFMNELKKYKLYSKICKLCKDCYQLKLLE